MPPKSNAPGGKRFITAKKTSTTAPNKSSSTEALIQDSPSKIPLRRGSLTGANSNSTAPSSKDGSGGRKIDEKTKDLGQTKSGEDKFSADSSKVIVF